MADLEPFQQKLERQQICARKIFDRALLSVKPDHVIDRHFRVEDNSVVVGKQQWNLSPGRKVWVFGIGKAAAAMAEAIEARLERAIYDGLIIVPYGTSHRLEYVQAFESAHPFPDIHSYAASLELAALMRKVKPGDLVIFLLSGGASALSCIPAGDLEVEDINEISRLLLNSGASIHEINTVRRHLSDSKGGNLARLLPECDVIQLLISDVPGDALHDIGSGPLASDPTTYNQALIVLKKYELTNAAPTGVVDHLKKGRGGNLRETVKRNNELKAEIYPEIMASSRIIAEKAAQLASEDGYNPYVLESAYSGETRKIAKWIAGQSIDVLSRDTPVPKPAALIFHGESYPKITGTGIGGRNQELALAFALAVEGQNFITLLSAGTDGIDGPTDAAGAICHSWTALDAREAGVDPESYLSNNDSYSFFSAMNSLVVTGATGTNVMDLQIVLIDK